MSTENVALTGQRFEEEVRSLGGAARVASHVGKSRNTIYNWFQTGDVTASDLALLAEHGLDVLYVLTGRRNVMAAQSSALAIAAGALNRTADELEAGLVPKIRVTWMDRSYTVDPSEYRWVPVLNVRVAGGDGSDGDGEQVVTFNAYRKDWLRKMGLEEAVLSEVTVSGKSMEPVLRHGEPVLVNHSAREIQGGDIYVLRLGRDLVVKYVQLMPDGSLQVTSENNSVFPPYYIQPDELGGNVEIIGRVVPRVRSL